MQDTRRWHFRPRASKCKPWSRDAHAARLAWQIKDIGRFHVDRWNPEMGFYRVTHVATIEQILAVDFTIQNINDEVKLCEVTANTEIWTLVRKHASISLKEQKAFWDSVEMPIE